ncbi:MAG: stage IV sporulation protein A [Clostridia bacterium]|nr:stage IV sporulation protein A [Clostridia bacterium]
MGKYDIYGDIAKRTNGDIYIGVVGPVRTGKSTFVSQFMEKVILPKIKNKNERTRAVDELPQSAEGKTIMTTQPKFVPASAVKITFADKMQANVRLIDCVGYGVEGAYGYNEEDKARLVKTPWSNENMTFEQAAEVGTCKVVEEHSNIAIVVTTDGSFTEIARTNYVDAEDKVITQLQSLGKPFVVLINSTSPESVICQQIRDNMKARYGIDAMCVDIKNITTEQIETIFSSVLQEFPLRKMMFSTPKWMRSLHGDDTLISTIASYIKKGSESVKKMKDCQMLTDVFAQDDRLDKLVLDNINLGSGEAYYSIMPNPDLFFRCLSEKANSKIDDEYSLMSFVTDCSFAKQQYEGIKDALETARATGYGIVKPSFEQMDLADPEIVKQGSRYGVKLRATAPSLHIMQVDITTEVNPMVGTEQQSQYLLEEFNANPKGIWKTDMFGKSMSSLAKEGLNAKLTLMPREAQDKMRKTVGRIVNEGKGSLVCLIL